ncbi:MAG TPA: R3H domain-containing nucleic acid-binding protein [Thermoanaerobaculia bacterium]|nr:R3H domain-containing nucleic acid-binding protein [Thermoanaerobaculia bacterium]
MSERFEGKNVDEALTLAAETLGVDRTHLTYHVLLEKRGFLGGVKRVVIEAQIDDSVSPTAPASQPSAPAAAASNAAAPVSLSNEHRPAPRGGRERGGNRGGGGGGERSRGGNRAGSDDRGDRGAGGGGGRGGRRGPRGGGSDFQVGDFERFASEVPQELLVQSPESDGAKTVRAWIDKALVLAKMDIEIRTEENDTQIIVRLFGTDAYRLVDRGGELLDALQVLANKSLTGRKVEKDIELDCEQFKEKRVEELGQKARELAERVRRDGREQLLPAMSPIERRIVHLALQDDAEVGTESRGEGFFKRVAVIRRSDAPAAAEQQPSTNE